jgi:hypothetical protein
VPIEIPDVLSIPQKNISSGTESVAGDRARAVELYHWTQRAPHARVVRKARCDAGTGSVVVGVAR